jgi:hypothetical protein
MSRSRARSQIAVRRNPQDEDGNGVIDPDGREAGVTIPCRRVAP